MRPRTLDEYAGQEHLLSHGMPVRAAIEEGRLGSVILWAPPGCGKTTLARLIAKAMDAEIEELSAVTAGVADIRAVASAARQRLSLFQRPTLLLLDEIHHFNRARQDSLLGALEDGVLQLVGATTENPFFVLNPALQSRARVLPLQPLEPGHIRSLLHRALTDSERGLGSRSLTLSEDALDHLVRCANGDARIALNGLEAASQMASIGEMISLEMVEQALQRPAVRYDRQGDQRYDTISAFIKSVRASDSDAALHYLARMIDAGEDPRFIARRLMILASEDIGNAEPQGLILAAAAAEAVERLGMPEGRIPLSQAAIFLAEAPKSNRAYAAIDRALADVREGILPPIPMRLRNAPTKGMKELGHGEGYLCPHDFPDAFAGQSCLPDDSRLQTPYYEPSDRGFEKRILERHAWRRSRLKGHDA
jgi:putative ATPase